MASCGGGYLATIDDTEGNTYLIFVALRGEGVDPEYFMVCEPEPSSNAETASNASQDNIVSPSENAADVPSADQADEVPAVDKIDEGSSIEKVDEGSSIEKVDERSSIEKVDEGSSIANNKDNSPAENIIVTSSEVVEIENTEVRKDDEVVADKVVSRDSVDMERMILVEHNENDETIEQTGSDLPEVPDVEEGDNVQTTDISEPDEDADQDALRLTIGEEDAIGEYDFQEEYANDGEESSEVEKESDIAEGSKSSLDSAKGEKAVNEEELLADSKDESVICEAADGNTETGGDSLTLSSSSSNEFKTPEEGSQDVKRREGNTIVVNELCSDCTATEIKSVFQKFGKIVGVKVISNNKATGPRRFAHVEMSSEDDVKKCILKTNDIKIHGHQLVVQRAAIDGSSSKKGGKSDGEINGAGEEQKSNQVIFKTPEERKGSSVTNTSSSSSSKQKEMEKKEKPSVEKKVKETSNVKDSCDKEKGKDHSAKNEKDKKSSSTKDSKSKSDAEKSKSGAGGTPTSSKPVTDTQGGRKVELRKDPKGRFFDKRRTFIPPRPPGFQRGSGNDAPGSGPPNRSSYHPRNSTPYPYRGRSPRSPQISLSRPCLTFDKIREHRERERMRENERKVRERDRRRREEEEKQRLIEKRNREEFLSLERERQQLRVERERVERDKQELMRIQKERQRTERENIEKEREELRRAQLKIEEHRRLLKRPFVESKDYLERKKPLITDIIRFDATGRSETFMPRHEAKLDVRGDVDRHDRDPRLDRGNLLRPSPREFAAPPPRTSVRIGEREDDWGDRSVISRDPRMEMKKALHSDDRRTGRIRGRAPGDVPAEYSGSYRPSTYVPMKASDHFPSEKAEYGRKSLERKMPSSSSAGSDSVMPGHFATDRVWSSARKPEPSWSTPDKMSGRSGHHSSDRWSSPSANMTALSGSRGSNIQPPVASLPSASSSLYPSVSNSSAATSGSSGRSAHMYGSEEFSYGRYRRF